MPVRRRDFIMVGGSAVLLQPLVAHGQQRPAMPVIGFLCSALPEAYASQVTAFHQGLNEAGFSEGATW